MHIKTCTDDQKILSKLSRKSVKAAVSIYNLMITFLLSVGILLHQERYVTYTGKNGIAQPVRDLITFKLILPD